MICAVFGENRVTLRGHADYAPRGEDIVCAAASALVFALIGALEEKGTAAGAGDQAGPGDGGGGGGLPGRVAADPLRAGTAGGKISGVRSPGGVSIEGRAYHGKEQICRKHRSGWGS